MTRSISWATRRPPTTLTDPEAVARRLGVEAVGPAACEVDRCARFPSEAFEALRAEGMLSMLVPRDLGGGGLRLAEVARVCEILGQQCASTGLIFAMHQIQVATVVSHGRSAWSRSFLAEVADRQLLLGSATTETGVGGDVRSSLCAVEHTDNGRFRIRKDAPVISYGEYADAILATARRESSSPANDQVMAVLPRATLTLEHRSGWDTLGFRGTCSDGYFLEAEGDVEQLLSDPFADISSRTMLPVSHILWASVWLGIATAALEITRAHLRGEAHKKPGTVPPSAVRVAELVGLHSQFGAVVECAKVEYEGSLRGDIDPTGMGFAIRMNSVKVTTSTLLIEIVGRALGICGMAGYREDSPESLGRHLRDAHGAALMINNDRILGANAQMLLVHKGSG